MRLVTTSKNPVVMSLWQTPARRVWLLWGYLLLVTLAELVTALVSPQVGQLAHVLLLAVLLVHAVLRPATRGGRMALALTLAPLIRVLSLSLPLVRFAQIVWYPIVAVPLLCATWVVVRQLKLLGTDLGMRPGQLILQMMLVGGGLGLGAVEYLILKPAPVVTSFTLTNLLVGSLILVIATGFTEELIFRGLLQTVGIESLGRWALLYVSLLFGVLHIGYLSLIDVVFVSLVGFVFACIVYWSGSILGVTLAHGLTNIVLFLVMPYYDENPLGTLQQQVTAAVWIGTALGLAGLGILIWQAWREGRFFISDADGARVLFTHPVLRSRWSRPLWPRRAYRHAVRSARFARRQFARLSATADDIPILREDGQPNLCSELPWMNAAIASAADPYAEIYQQLSGDPDLPLLHVHIATRARLVMSAILFVPTKHQGAGQKDRTEGCIHLYSEGGLTKMAASALLPRHFCYVEGIVYIGTTSSGIVDRATTNKADLFWLGWILSKRLTQEVTLLAEQQPAAFRAFWTEYGSYFEANSDSAGERRKRWLGPSSLETNIAEITTT